uniref:Uncharacterized protein n=1 Tax=Candidatus Kentrum eta TaxID=2126337 RepID=A0A450VKL4_9GAMM|nr:MAG: hypothetical protein BECKH772A_GA0070896_102522 [Candidatus Kentron sp. H]VFK02334.1 MAG: hypothetical protein BECKH772B_GA0070898_102744 [Candidatus Kentron sp. H]VFK05354.1 MAG: hypothetical protein BECKH772C_GA0070978_102622 [Candidatus Kentron sp. H]
MGCSEQLLSRPRCGQTWLPCAFTLRKIPPLEKWHGSVRCCLFTIVRREPLQGRLKTSIAMPWFGSSTNGRGISMCRSLVNIGSGKQDISKESRIRRKIAIIWLSLPVDPSNVGGKPVEAVKKTSIYCGGPQIASIDVAKRPRLVQAWRHVARYISPISHTRCAIRAFPATFSMVERFFTASVAIFSTPFSSPSKMADFLIPWIIFV